MFNEADRSLHADVYTFARGVVKSMILSDKEKEEILSLFPNDLFAGKTFMITGATGFLGGALVELIISANRYYDMEPCTVIAVCRNIEKAKAKFGPMFTDNNIVFRSIELTEKIPIEQNVDYLIHTASNSSTYLFKAEPVDTLLANTVGTENLLEFAKAKEVKSFVFLSSGAVYGDITEGIASIDETRSYGIELENIYNSYAIGKLCGEFLCKAYYEQYGVPSKCIRISHTYGPGIDLNDGKVFSDFIKNIIDRSDIIIKGTGEDYRTFCYISDALKAFFYILFRGENGQSYNMANNKELYSIKALAEVLVKEAFPELGLSAVIKGEKSSEYGDKGIVLASTNKLEKLGWKPGIGVVEGFRRTVSYYEENKHGSF